MKKKVLIIGFGSIGKKHATILKKFKSVSEVYILSQRSLKTFKSINKLSQIKKINPDYIIICSRTSDHFKHLNYIERNFSKKIVLIEKPLFNKFYNFDISKNKRSFLPISLAEITLILLFLSVKKTANFLSLFV